jgi:hypothetical protein
VALHVSWFSDIANTSKGAEPSWQIVTVAVRGKRLDSEDAGCRRWYWHVGSAAVCDFAPPRQSRLVSGDKARITQSSVMHHRGFDGLRRDESIGRQKK